MGLHKRWAKVGIVRVVEVRQSAVCVLLLRVEDHLRSIADFNLLGLGEVGPDEGVVHHAARVAVSAFQASSYNTHPCVVDAGVQHTEVPQLSVGDKEDKVATENFRANEPKWDVVPSFGRNLWHHDGGALRHVLHMEPSRRISDLPSPRALTLQAELLDSLDPLFTQRKILRRHQSATIGLKYLVHTTMPQHR